MPAPKEPSNFESAMTELESLVERMDTGQLPLEESLKSYQRGIVLLKYCEKVLADAEQRVKVLDGGELRELDDDDIAR